jgi:hypothetical protein
MLFTMATKTSRVALILALATTAVDAFSARQPIRLTTTSALSKTQLFVASSFIRNTPNKTASYELDDPLFAEVNKPSLSPEDAWIAELDYQGFAREVKQLGKDLLEETNGEENVAHLKKMLTWQNALAFCGIFSMWMTPNPLTIVALSTWQFSSWLMIAHHTQHGGYNRYPAGKFNSRVFALGTLKRRVLDWLDWIQPEAWNHEHNILHHYRLNELAGKCWSVGSSVGVASDLVLYT